MSGFSEFTQTTGGKIGIGAVILIAVGAFVFEFSHMNSDGQSRDVSPTQAVSDAQQQIDAINKMANLSPEAKKAMIAHEQGEINTAKGSMSGGHGVPPAQPGTTH